MEVRGVLKQIKWHVAKDSNGTHNPDLRYRADVGSVSVGWVREYTEVWHGGRHKVSFTAYCKLTEVAHSSNTAEQAKIWLEKEYLRFVKRFIKIEKK